MNLRRKSSSESMDFQKVWQANFYIKYDTDQFCETPVPQNAANKNILSTKLRSAKPPFEAKLICQIFQSHLSKQLK